MDNREFVRIRHHLGKTQNQLAQLLCVSPKAVQSFEQGWRRVPTEAERQLLFLLACKMSAGAERSPCWQMKKCPAPRRDRCPAWEFRSGDYCWFVSGTFCGGSVRESWVQKMRLCRRCRIYRSMVPAA
jgi:DNA-binding XRE family transcriptional regulator